MNIRESHSGTTSGWARASQAVALEIFALARHLKDQQVAEYPMPF